MSTNTSPQPDHGGGPSRPSLFGTAPPAGVPDAPLSVLAALDGPAPAPPRTGRRAFPWIGALAVLLVAGAAAWMLRTPVPAAEPVVVAAAAPAAPASAVLPVTVSAEPVAPAASAAMAAIEELPAPVAAPPLPVVAAAPPASSATKARSRERVEKTEKDKRTQVARTETRARPAPKTEGRAAPAGAASAAVPSPGNDADVDLIAALVQHLSRDTRGAELGIADLVARCRSLQGSEALRCQRRICENYWGRADACPRSQAPNEVAARP